MSFLKSLISFALTASLLFSVVAARGAQTRRHAANVARASAARASDADAERRREAFEMVWQTVSDYHFDPKFGGLDWEAVRREFAPRVERAQTDAELHRLLQEMLNRLGQSHFTIVPPEIIPEVGTEDEESDEGDAGPDDDDDLFGDGFGVTEQLTHGIGIDLRIINNQAVVTRVGMGSPAERAGLRPGFIVTRVGGQSMSRILRLARRAVAIHPSTRHQLPQEIVVEFFNGPPGTDVSLSYLDARNRLRRASVRRERLAGEMSVPLQAIPAQYVEFESRRLRNGVGYIRFNLFALPVMDKFCAALRSMKDAPGIVIDLRGNRGGVLGLVYGMGGLLVSQPLLLGILRSREGMRVIQSFPQKSTYTGQVVILIDGGSVSASEIFAAGLQEPGRAVVIGERSAGATLPSVAKELPTGAILQYAFADFRTARGNRLEGKGVRPDVEVKLDRRSLLAGRDPQLDAALDAVYIPSPGDGSANVATAVASVPPDKSEDIETEKTQAFEASVDAGVEEIIENYVRAVGGREALEKISSRVSKGTFEGSFAGTKVEGTLEILEKAPNKSVTLIDIPGMGIMRRGFTGLYGYEQVPLFGFRRLEDLELADTRLASEFYWMNDLKRLYPKLALKGREKVGEAEAHVLEATPADGRVVKFYFDVRTGLLLRKDGDLYEDYRKVDGVVIPFTVRGSRYTVRLREVRHNVALDDERFTEEKNCFTQ